MITAMQKEAHSRIDTMPDATIKLLIQLMDLIGTRKDDSDSNAGIKAYQKLRDMSAYIKTYMPDDPRTEMLEGIDEKYGRVG